MADLNPPVSNYANYRPPPMADPLGDKLGRDKQHQEILRWQVGVLQEGFSFLSTQPAWPHIQRSCDLIYLTKKEEIPPSMSRLTIPETRRAITEIVATYSNFRIISDIRSTDPDYKHQQKILNDLYIDWYLTNNADRWFKKAFQTAAVKGTGWVSPQWIKPHLGIAGEGRIVLRVYDHKSVIPIQLGADNDIQEAFGVILVNEVPIARAHAMFPEFTDELTPDRQAPTGVRKAVRKLRRAGSIALAMFGVGGKIISDGTTTFPTVDIFHIYVKDNSINNSGETVLMGDDIKNSWAYFVPSYLDSEGKVNRVPTGEAAPWNPATASWGEAPTRVVTREECMLYPRGRQIISTRTTILHDGPNQYWHGKFPVAKISFDEWPDALLGYPLTVGVIDIEQTINRLVRCIENSAKARLNPPYSYDDSVDDSTANSVNPAMAGQRWKENRLLGDGIKFPFPFQFYDVPQFIPEFITTLGMKLRDMLGLDQTMALQRARQMPSGDTMQKMMEMMGAIVDDRSRSIETFVVELGEQILSHFFQFYTLERRLRVMGVDGASIEDIDSDPRTLIPDNLPGTTRAQRGIQHLKRFHYNVTPRSLHELNSLSRRMLLLQLQRGGFPIDSQTVGEACDIPRLGVIVGDTVFEKYMNEQIAKIKKGIELQKEQAAALQPFTSSGVNMNSLDNQFVGALVDMMRNGVNPRGHAGPGQPSSGQQPPSLQSKDNGTRQVVSESGG